MTVYIRSQDNLKLVELGELLIIGGAKKESILTGNKADSLALLGSYENHEEAKEKFEEIVGRILSPSIIEKSADMMYIDLSQ